MSREFFFHWGSWCDRDREIGIEIFLPLFTFLQMGQKGGTERLKMGQKDRDRKVGQNVSGPQSAVVPYYHVSYEFSIYNILLCSCGVKILLSAVLAVYANLTKVTKWCPER